MKQLRAVKIISAKFREPVELAEYLAEVAGNPIVSAGDLVEEPAVPALDAAATFSLLSGNGDPPPMQINRYTEQLKSLVLHLLREEFRRRVAGRSRLQFLELREGLVPFTDVCHPLSIRMRQCACGNWMTVGDGICGFCGDAEPGGRTTRAWRVGQRVVEFRDPQDLNVQAPATSAGDDPDIEDLEDESNEEPEIDWGAVYD